MLLTGGSSSRSSIAKARIRLRANGDTRARARGGLEIDNCGPQAIAGGCRESTSSIRAHFEHRRNSAARPVFADHWRDGLSFGMAGEWRRHGVHVWTYQRILRSVNHETHWPLQSGWAGREGCPNQVSDNEIEPTVSIQSYHDAGRS